MLHLPSRQQELHGLEKASIELGQELESPSQDQVQMTCEHGVDEDSFCMLCCREGEGKPPPKKDPPKTWEECMEEDDRD